MAIEFTETTKESIDEDSHPPFSLSLQTKVSGKDRTFFTEQLALLLETGNTLIDSLKMVAEQTENSALVSIINDIIELLNNGKPFSYALAQHPEVFSKTYVTLIAASEDGGYMHSVLEHILDMEKKRDDLLSTLRSAFTYPAFLIVFAFVVIIFILVFVFPKFTEMFSKIEDELPAITLLLMWTSDFIRHYWWALLIAVFGFISLCLWSFQNDGARLKLNDMIARLPILGELLYEIYLIQTMRIIGLSLSNGVPLVESIHICKDMVQNSRYLLFIESLHKNVIEGNSFSHAFETTDFIPSLIRQMVKTGEESGKLALVCSRIADYYQQELSRKLKSLSKMIEPIMLLLMGILVGLIVSSLILPIFKLSRAVH